MGDRSVDRVGGDNPACACPVNPVTLQSSLRSYTMLANSLFSLDVSLDGSQRKEAGTSLYWKTTANHADKKTSTVHPVMPMDAQRMKRICGAKRATLQKNMALGRLKRSAKYWKP